MQLTDTQIVVLTAAVARDDGSILPLPQNIRGGTVAKVCAALVAKGLAAEVEAKRGDPIWGEAGDGPAVTLIATAAAFEKLGVDHPQAATQVDNPAPTGAEAPTQVATETAASAPTETAPSTSKGSKRNFMMRHLR